MSHTYICLVEIFGSDLKPPNFMYVILILRKNAVIWCNFKIFGRAVFEAVENKFRTSKIYNHFRKFDCQPQKGIGRPLYEKRFQSSDSFVFFIVPQRLTLVNNAHFLYRILDSKKSSCFQFSVPGLREIHRNLKQQKNSILTSPFLENPLFVLFPA